MIKPDQEETKDPFWNKRIYTNSELSEFDRKYKAHKFKNDLDFLKYVGAVSSRNAVYSNVQRGGVIAYIYWQNLLHQWDDYIARVQFRIRQGELELSKLSETISEDGCF